MLAEVQRDLAIKDRFRCGCSHSLKWYVVRISEISKWFKKKWIINKAGSNLEVKWSRRLTPPDDTAAVQRILWCTAGHVGYFTHSTEESSAQYSHVIVQLYLHRQWAYMSVYSNLTGRNSQINRVNIYWSEPFDGWLLHCACQSIISCPEIIFHRLCLLWHHQCSLRTLWSNSASN